MSRTDPMYTTEFDHNGNGVESGASPLHGGAADGLPVAAPQAGAIEQRTNSNGTGNVAGNGADDGGEQRNGAGWSVVAEPVEVVPDAEDELALTAGLSIQDIQFGLMGTGNVGIVEQEVSGLTAPLPSFGISGGYAFTEKWVGRAALGLFAFDLAVSDESDISGEIFNAKIAIYHNTFENVHFGLKYSFFDVSVEFEDAQRINSINYKYHGPILSVDFVF